MAEHHHEESLMEKIADKIHGHDDSSSSDSDGESSSVKAKIFRIFGREKPVHKVLGGGKLADVFLWKNKKVSGGVLGVSTAMWVLFELIEYHLLTLVCHSLILALAVLFLWSNASSFITKSRPHIPEAHLPNDLVRELASDLTLEINQGLSILHSIASGRDLKKFLYVTAGLWFLSIVGNWCNFLTLFYTAVVLLFTIPVVYDKYEDKIDPLAEKATIEFKKHYAVFDAKVLSEVKKQYAVFEVKVLKKVKKA